MIEYFLVMKLADRAPLCFCSGTHASDITQRHRCVSAKRGRSSWERPMQYWPCSIVDERPCIDDRPIGCQLCLGYRAAPTFSISLPGTDFFLPFGLESLDHAGRESIMDFAPASLTTLRRYRLVNCDRLLVALVSA